MATERGVTMRKSPRVSIGMPVYNGEKTIAAALASILQQTFNDFEVIISDNASTDSTRKIAQEFCNADRRVRYSRNDKNLGAHPNFNRAFTLSQGEYFKWAHHDDTIAPDYLEKCVRVLDEDSSFVMCWTKGEYVDVDGVKVPHDEKPLKLDSNDVGVRFWEVLMESRTADQIDGLIRRSALEKTALMRPFVGAEKILLAELIVQGRCKQIPEYLFFKGCSPEMYSLLKTEEAQKKWVSATPNQMPAGLNYLLGYVKAVWHSPLSPRDFAKCCFALLNYTFGWNTWKSRLRRRRLGPGYSGSLTTSGRFEIGENRD
ncbi:MAG: glycosyltransferase family 2 protein [Pyrinomonadaceae bacterium]